MGKKHKFTPSEREARKFLVGMTVLVAVVVAIGVFVSIEITSSRRGETIPRGVPVDFARPEDAMPSVSSTVDPAAFKRPEFRANYHVAKHIPGVPAT